MVIIQRWEPVISATFPSLIPFWIRIKGLPLHFWHGDMVCRIGQELGTLVNHELTKTTARVRVLIDGLKPLVKEAIVDFDSGEEGPITLEYEKLESHCFYCFSLLHARKNCPERMSEVAADHSSFQRDMTEARTGSYPVISAPVSTLARAPGYIEPESQPSRLPAAPLHNLQSTNILNNGERRSFQERVDRYGNTFGERVSTKQTRNPLP